MHSSIHGTDDGQPRKAGGEQDVTFPSRGIADVVV